MTQGVASGMFENSGFQPRFSKCALQNRFVKMMSAPFIGDTIHEMARCRKYPLPTPFLAGIRIFALEYVWQSNTSRASFEVGLSSEKVIAVGTVIADRPPHRSVRAELPHTVLTLDADMQTSRSDTGE